MSDTTKNTDRRQHIIDVAITSFSRTGYHNTSMTDIADAVGVTKPVLYQHFDSKRALYLEILRFVGQALVTAITSNASSSTDGREQTERAMIAYFTWVNDHRDAFALLFESSERVDEEFASTVREFEELASSEVAPLIAVDLPDETRRTLERSEWADALASLVKDGRRKSLEIRKVNGEAVGHDHPVVAQLERVGFVASYRGWVLRD